MNAIENALRCVFAARAVIQRACEYDPRDNEFRVAPTDEQAAVLKELHGAIENLISAAVELAPDREYGWHEQLIPADVRF